MNFVAFALGVVSAALGALCAAADGALLDPVRERQGAEPPTAPLADTRGRAHRALSFARLMTHLVSGVVFAIALDLSDHSWQVATLLAFGLAIVLVLAAETGARALGEIMGSRLLQPLRPFVRVVETVFAPVMVLGGWFDSFFQRLFPFSEPTEADRETSAQRFSEVVEAEGDSAREQRTILHGVFSLGDTDVQDVMVPRVDILGLEAQTPWSAVVDRVLSSEHARLPVYDETLDHIIGILYAKDLLAAVIADQEPPPGWRALARAAAFIPETKKIDAQLRDFRATSTHIAIVVDEYGGTAGLITIEDVLEEIVGDIRDEYDQEEPPIEAQDGKRFWVAGRVSLDDLSDALGHPFERSDISTVGGLVYEELGRVPRSGEELTFDGFRVVVERVVRRRIERVYFERLEAMAERQSS